MPKTKTQAEAPNRATPAPVVEQQPATPEKQGGPSLAARTPVPSALPPPNGAPPPARAADLMTALEGGPGAAGRVRMMTAMQGTVGNARLGRMLDATASLSTPAAAPPLVPERAPTVAPREVTPTPEAPPEATPRAAAAPETARPTLETMEAVSRGGTPASEAGPAPTAPVEAMAVTASTETTAPDLAKPESATQAPTEAPTETTPVAATAEAPPETGAEAAPSAGTPTPTIAPALTTSEVAAKAPPEVTRKAVPPHAAPPEVGAAAAPAMAAPEALRAPAGAREAVAEAGPAAEIPAKSPPEAVAGVGAAPGLAAAGPPSAPGAAGEPGAGAPPPEARIDTSSSEGLLQSLASVPPSAAGDAMEKTSAAVPGIQAQEKADLEASFPEVERPTGLPRKSERKPAKPTVLEKGKAPERLEKAGRRGKPPEVKHKEARGHVPGSRVSTEVTEPREEEGGSWWSRIFNRIRSFISSLPTRDPGVSTSAGPRPSVDLSGEANPQQNLQKKQASDQEVNVRRTQANAAISEDFGEKEKDVRPDVPKETLRPAYKPTAPMAAPTGPGKAAPALAGQDRAMFDQTASSWYASKVNEERDKYRLEQETYRAKSEEARAEGQRRIAEETARTRAEQETMQEQARSDVEEERQRWREQNRKIQENYDTKSEAKRKEIDQKISDKAKNAETESDQKLAEAEAKAETERRKAEAKAAEEKRKAKKKPRSWWQRVKGAVSSAFKAIKKAVNAIFDGLRKLVKGIIEAAKAVVRGIIELARRAIVGLIKAFGEILKGLVTIALAAFPEAAAKARAWIDRRVDQAVTAVNKAAEALKKATDAILDFVGKVLDTALAVVQKVMNVIVDVLNFLVVGLMEIMERIGYLVSAARQMPDHFWGQAQEEVIGMNLNEPLPFERTGPPKPEDAAAAGHEAGLIPSQDMKVLQSSELSDADIVVDEVAVLDEVPEFFARLNLQEGQELVFGESDDPTRSFEAIKAEALGTASATAGAPPGVEESASEATQAAPPMTPEKELEELLKQKPEGGCAKEKKCEPAKGGEVPEHMKKGPFTPAQRGRYLWHQMKQGIKQWFDCNWPWLLAAAVGVLLGLILLSILTGGAILAALPLIMQIVGAIMIGVAIARVTAYVGEYLSQGWQGNITGAAKSLARGLVIGAIELIFALLFNLGAVIKAMKAGLKAATKTAAKAAKATVTTTIRNVRQLGRLGLQAGKAAIRNGKLVLKGIKSGVVKGAKSLDDLAKRLWQRVRFRKFKIAFHNGWFRLLGYINPWVVLMEGPLKGQLAEVSEEAVKSLKKGSEGFFEVGGKAVKARVLSVTRKVPKRYRTNFDMFAGKSHKDFVIHHLVEQQSRNLSKLVDDVFLHAPANLRAIPKGITNEVVHLSKIRVIWNTLYRRVADLSDEAIFVALKHYAAYTDDFLSTMLSYADEMGEALTKEGLKQAAEAWLNANSIEKAVDAAISAAKQVR